MTKRIIPTTDGRLIEIEEGELKKPPPKTPWKKSYKRERNLRKEPIKRSKFPEEKEMKRGTSKYVHIPGFNEWWGRHLHELIRAKGPESRPGRRTYETYGETRKQALERIAKAKEKAAIHMANIKKVVPDIANERAESAMLATLEIMEAATTQEMKLKAARQVLEWTAAKPVAKSEVTVNAAEAWLASIAEQAKDGD